MELKHPAEYGKTKFINYVLILT